MLMVTGVAEAEGGAGPSATETWKGWHRKRKIGQRKLSRSLSAEAVANLTDAWYFAAQSLGLNCKLFVTVRPHDIDDLAPSQRQERWQDILNQIAQFAPDHDFERIHIWSRESDPGTGTNEHLHILIHVPPKLIRRFKDNASGWFAKAAEIDIRRADYRVRWTASGKQRSVSAISPRTRLKRPTGVLVSTVRAARSSASEPDAPGTSTHPLGQPWEARRAIQREFGIRMPAAVIGS
jgi:hypothetical protein